MTTYAGIIVQGSSIVEGNKVTVSVAFYVDREGYPEYIVELLRNLAKDCKSVWELIGKLYIELWDSEMLILNPPEWEMYEYIVDFDNNKISWKEDEKTITVPLK